MDYGEEYILKLLSKSLAEKISVMKTFADNLSKLLDGKQTLLSSNLERIKAVSVQMAEMANSLYYTTSDEDTRNYDIEIFRKAPASFQWDLALMYGLCSTPPTAEMKSNFTFTEDWLRRAKEKGILQDVLHQAAFNCYSPLEKE